MGVVLPETGLPHPQLEVIPIFVMINYMYALKNQKLTQSLQAMTSLPFVGVKYVGGEAILV